jgi:hypothetical protein
MSVPSIALALVAETPPEVLRAESGLEVLFWLLLLALPVIARVLSFVLKKIAPNQAELRKLLEQMTGEQQAAERPRRRVRPVPRDMPRELQEARLELEPEPPSEPRPALLDEPVPPDLADLPPASEPVRPRLAPAFQTGLSEELRADLPALASRGRPGDPLARRSAPARQAVRHASPWRRAVVLSEILGPPVALRGPSAPGLGGPPGLVR